MEILCLGNEFIKIDSLAKEVGQLLKKDHEIIDVKDTFQLMVYLQRFEHPVILDVVKGLNDVKVLSNDDIKQNSILSAHDFDASYAIKLVNKPVRIIGIPLIGDSESIYDKVLRVL